MPNHSRGLAGPQAPYADSELDAVLAASQERARSAVISGLDLEAGLLQIVQHDTAVVTADESTVVSPTTIRQTARESAWTHVAASHPVEQSTAEIVNLLADVPALREAAGRTILVHYISEAVGAPLLLPDLPHPKFYLYHLVLACREIPDGLRLLVDGVEFVAGGSRAVTRLRRLISPVRDHLESVDEAQLEDLLVGLRVRSLARLYYAATGSGIARTPFRLTDAWDAFTALLDHNTAPDRPSPHLIFIAMLLRTMQVSEGAGPEDIWRIKRLRDWMALQTERLRAAGAVTQADYLDRMRGTS